jgi:glycosyltransferase involved in cell wall biosynthesis
MSYAASKPRLAIASNYEDSSCGVAAYTRVREEAFAELFDVTVLDLRSANLMRPPGRRREAELRVDEICEQLDDFDVTVLDTEFGIWGGTLEESTERLTRCCAAAKRLILTVHTVFTDTGPGAAFARAQSDVLAGLAQRDRDRPYCLVAHSRKDDEMLRAVYGMANVETHPLCFVTKSQKRRQRGKGDWRKKLGFSEDDQVIGLFGSFSKYKDNKCVLRALSYLPNQYKAVFVGGAHPFSRKPFEYDENLAEVVNLIDGMAGTPRAIEGRVTFLGVVEDEAFLDAMVGCDFVVIPYHDAGQFASGVASAAFEYGKRIVATNSNVLAEYKEFYGGCFEQFDVGNHFELRDKILRFDTAKARRARKVRDRYTPESMAELHHAIFDQLVDPAYRNNARRPKIAAAVASSQPRDAEKGMREKAGAFLHLTLSDPRQALTALKRKVSA